MDDNTSEVIDTTVSGFEEWWVRLAWTLPKLRNRTNETATDPVGDKKTMF